MSDAIYSRLTFLLPGNSPTCPDCGRSIRITQKGLIGKHTPKGYGSWYSACIATGTKY